MRMAKRVGGVVGVALVGLCSMGTTACTMAADGGLPPKKNEPVQTTSAAQSAAYGNIDCQGSPVTVVTAEVMSSAGGVAVYTNSVSNLLSTMCSNPSCGDDAPYYFTSEYYSNIYGAAGYYYRVSNFFPTISEGNNQAGYFWIAIPIIDSQQDVANPVGYYYNPPSLSAVRFPTYAQETNGFPPEPVGFESWATGYQFWPKASGNPLGTWVGWNGEKIWPFTLRSSDYNSLANLMAYEWCADENDFCSYDPEVLAQDQTCVLIVDQNGHPLDFAAHLAQWDPKPPCAGCNR
jgi:hypothetical protein